MVYLITGDAKNEVLTTSGFRCLCTGDVFCRSYDPNESAFHAPAVFVFPLCSHGNVRGVNMRGGTHKNDVIKKHEGSD